MNTRIKLGLVTFLGSVLGGAAVLALMLAGGSRLIPTNAGPHGGAETIARTSVAGDIGAAPFFKWDPFTVAPAFAGNAVNNPPSAGGAGTVTTSAPATGDGSGGSPVTVRASSTSQSGYMSAAQALALYDVGLVNAWQRARADELVGYVPALTQCKGGPFGWAFYAGTAATSVNTSVEGGGTSPAGGGVNFLTNYLTATPKTGSFGFAFKALYQVPVAGRASNLGLSDAGLTANHSIDVRTQQSVDATHFIFKVGATTSVFATVVSAVTLYSFTVYCNGTNCVARINNADAQTIAQSNVAADEKVGFYDFNTTGGDVIISDMIICLP